MAEKVNLANIIWQTADDELRNVLKPHEYGQIILPFFVLKRLDSVIKSLDPNNEARDLYEKNFDMEEDERERFIFDATELPYYNTAKYNFDEIAKGDANQAYENFENYIASFSKNIRTLIENFKFNDELEELRKQKRFFSFIQHFAEIDMSPENYDNAEIGNVYEDLLRRWSEMSNETAGEHFTPKDVVNLLVGIVFSGKEDELNEPGLIRNIYDPCCGYGGMLTTAKKYIEENISKNVTLVLKGQEINTQTHSGCAADFIMMGLDSSHIIGPSSTLTDDLYTNDKFHFQLANPPFGVSWNTGSTVTSVKDELNSQTFNGRSRFVNLPRTSDGQLLFLQIMMDKMEPNDSRIGMVSNGSPLFTGDAGSGESEIRKYILENDLLEAMIALPDNMFYNTGIATYLWIINNNKSSERKGKVQLIDGSGLGTALRKNLGNKNKEVSEESRNKIIDIFTNFEENEISKIYDNDFLDTQE